MSACSCGCGAESREELRRNVVAALATVPASGHCQRVYFAMYLRSPDSCRRFRDAGHVLALCRACNAREAREAT